MGSEQLGIADVERLMANPSEESRVVVAMKLARQFSEVKLTQRERDLAHEILGFLVHDVALNVREALSSCLKDNPEAPRHIILQLARDMDCVALPVLTHSPVLTDEDLVGLVYYGTPAKQSAVAAREKINASVSEAIIHRGDRNAVLRLVHNSGAVINEVAATMLVERYAHDEEVSMPLVQRRELPALLVERLIAMMTERLGEYLVEQKIDDDTAETLSGAARERVMVTTLARLGNRDLAALVEQLDEAGRLTGTLVLRAACMGEIRFVEEAFARLTGLTSERVWRLIHDVGALGFRAIYARAAMPEELYPAFRMALDIYHDMREEDGSLDLVTYRTEVRKELSGIFGEAEAPDLNGMIDRLTKRADAEVASKQKHVA